MKLFKVFGILTALIMTVSLSSCMKNDDSDDLETKWDNWLKQVDTEIKASVGSYEGKLYSQPNQSAETETETGTETEAKTEPELDSVDAVWTFNSDSTMDLLNVPAELLVKKIPESQKTLQEAVANAGNVNIHVKLVYDYYYCSPLVMYVYPEYVTFPVTYEGATHQVKITFWNSEKASGTYAKYMMKDDTGYVHKCIVELYPEALYLDDKLQAQFTANAYLIWYGAKK